MKKKYYLGIDLHKRFAYWHLSTQEGDILWEGKVPTDKEATEKALTKCGIAPEAIVSAIESVESYGWYADLLTSLHVGEVKLANPWELSLLTKSPLKNDKRDAETITKYLRGGILPESYLAPKETRELRELVRTREYFVRMRTSAKIRIRSALAKQGLICKAADIISPTSFMWMKEQDIAKNYREEIGSLCNTISSLNKEIATYKHLMKQEAKKHSEIPILKSIPGIGDIRALIIKAEVGDFSRFPHPDKLTAYAGLVPSSHSSGGKERFGRITKRGPKLLRYAMVGAVQTINASWGDLYTAYEKKVEQSGSGRAKVKVARKLLKIAWYLVRKNEPYIVRFTTQRVESTHSVNV